MGLPLPSTAAINTFEPAILFAVLYTVLALLYIWRTAHNPAYPFIVLVIFCVCEPFLYAADLRMWLKIEQFAWWALSYARYWPLPMAQRKTAAS